MLTPDGPKVLEFNVRFGDPETQVVLPRLDGDLAALLAEAASGSLRTRPRFTGDAAVCVVMASEGYPEVPRTGDPIVGLDDAARVEGVTVFHAGTAPSDPGRPRARWSPSGGRVLGVTGLGPSLEAGPVPGLPGGGGHLVARGPRAHRHRPGRRGVAGGADRPVASAVQQGVR